MGSNSPTIAGTPDLFEIKKQTASYTFRTPGTYQLAIPPGVEVRASVQGAQAPIHRKDECRGVLKG